MKWIMLSCGLLILLCNLSSVANADVEEHYYNYMSSRGNGQPPLVAHAPRHLVRVAQTTPHQYDTATESQDHEGRVKLPEMQCFFDYDCMQYSSDLDLVCEEGQCMCRPPECWIYQYVITGSFSAKNKFFCGTCGSLGSWCNDTVQCDYPGKCWADGYCHCDKGENYDGVCLTSNLSWATTLAFSAMGIMCFIALVIIAVNCFQNPPCRNADWRHCRCCQGVSIASRRSNPRQRPRRGSCEKTPAYTVQVNNALQELSRPEDDVPEAPSYVLQGAVPKRHNHQQNVAADTEEPITSSSTSLPETTQHMSTVNESLESDASVADPSSSPPPSPSSSPPPPPHPNTTTRPPPPTPPPPPSPPLSGSPSASRSSRSDSTLSSPLPPSPYASTFPTPPPSPTSSASSSDSYTSPASLPNSHMPHFPHQSSCSTGEGNEPHQENETDTELKKESSCQHPSSNLSSEASVSLVFSGGCTHERCKLCLPKALASPHHPAPPARRRSPKKFDHVRKISRDSPPVEVNIELTHL